MHIVMLSDAETQGGAAISASRLATALVESGNEVTRIVGSPDGRQHSWITRGVLTNQTISIAFRIARHLCPPRALKILECRLAKRLLVRSLKELRPDFINVHNLHGAGWFPQLISGCTTYAPTVWTMHDMWSFTGRCIYSYDCRKFLTGCDAACPTATEHPARAPRLIRGDWEKRRDLLNTQGGLIGVAPSTWMAKEARAGLWRNRQVEVIPYGVPLEIYHPVNRSVARQALGIESSSPVFSVVAQKLSERRKGGALLIEALQRSRIRPLTLLTMGEEPMPCPSEGIRVHSLGYVDHERMKVLAYSAADALVHPAPVDNLPNVVMESLACGTPVIGFGIGGVPDMVRPGLTGWLAESLSSEGLERALSQACADLATGKDLRESCRAVAEKEYPMALQAQRYLTLFHSIRPPLA